MASLNATLKATPPASTPPPPTAEVPSAAPPTPAVVAPAAEVAPAPPVEPPSFDIAKPTKAEQWKQVKERAEQSEARAAKAEAMLAKIGDPERVLKLSEEAEQLRRTLREVAADRDPELQAQFNTRRAALVEDAKEAVGAELAGEVATVLERYGANAGPKIRELLKEHTLDQLAVTQLASAVSGIKQIEAERKGLVERSAQNWSKHVTEQTLAQERQMKQALAQRESALEDLMRENAGNPLLKDGGDEVAAVARRVLTGDMDHDEVARAALMVGTFPRLVTQAQKQAARIAELEAQVNKLLGGAPGSGGGASAPSGAPNALPPTGRAGVITPGLSAGSLAMQAMRQQGVI